jgi:wyosine [tRNA(Phe)-imidazoG37] synthetase (radical SAM superfamily)
MKLDAGDPATLTRINRPAPGVSLDRIIEGLKEIPRLIIQSLLIRAKDGKDGEVSNVRGAPYEAWLSALADVKPVRVQIYSTDRPVPEAGIERVAPHTLGRIAAEVETRTGLPVDAYWVRG